MAKTVRVKGKIETEMDHGYPVQKYRIFVNEIEVSIEESLTVMNHSPGGFRWGYGGSGPAQTALAILLALEGKDLAIKHHQAFKWSTIAKLNPDKDFDIEVTIADST